jgi:hypothetical protein
LLSTHFSGPWTEIPKLRQAFFRGPAIFVGIPASPQVSPHEQLTGENFAPEIPLTCRLRGNKIQLQKFLTVAMPSKLILPLNITLVEQGIKCSPLGVSISIS